jgi:hypothetical protein
MKPTTLATIVPNRKRLVRLVGAVLAGTLVAAACNSSSSDTAQDVATPSESTVTATALAPSTTVPPVTSSTTTVTALTTTTLPQTSTTLAATTTTSATTSTTTAPSSSNHSPEVSITSPGNLSSHIAAYDPESQQFRAVVSMSAAVSDPDGDPVTVEWYSSLSGYLGTGEFITASLITIYDSSQPIITARATDEDGTSSEDTIQIIVWIPSDT